MHWDGWALLSIVALCTAVIGWSCWGFYAETRSERSNPLRLSLIGGGYVDVHRPTGCPPGRHRSRGRR